MSSPYSPSIAYFKAVAAKTYATWNPSDKGTSVTLSNGNLTAATSAVSANNLVRSTIGKSSGKWYWEIHVDSFATFIGPVGVAKSTATLSGFCGVDTNGWGYGGFDGKKYTGNTGTAYGNTWTTGDVISTALDMDNGKVWFAKNGTWQNSGDPSAGTGAAFTGLSGTLFAMCPGTNASSSQTYTADFGATAFAFTVPTGFNSGLYN